jgi:hypothetical protein
LRLGRDDQPTGAAAALRVAAHLAAVHEAELVVESTGRLPRRLSAAVEELTRGGHRVRLNAGPDPARVVVAGEPLDGAHLVVRAEADADLTEPAEWVALLPRGPVRAEVSGVSASGAAASGASVSSVE